jgi:MoaA/NifB/PqqE/SkfB family radical SAM enzyme
MFLDIEEVRVLNIEHTSCCNLKCPQCARTLQNGNLNPNVKLKSMTLDDYKRILKPTFLKQLNQIFFCGNYGDALADPKFLNCVKYLRDYNVPLTIYTNGSLRSMKWWEELATLLDDKCKVVFAIDGLEDSNSIYRIGSNFNKIIENAKVFINNGGVARWDYLIFEHNYKQVEKAKEIAKAIGFKIFNKKKTKRFIDNENYKTNKGRGQFKSIVNRYGSWDKYIEQTTIDCKYKKEKILYIDYDLNLWPCCWIGAPMFFDGTDNIQKTQLITLLRHYEKGFNSLREHSIEEVLNHTWFANDLQKSFTHNKLMTCGRTCGEEYKFSSGDKTNKQETEL